MGPPLTQKDVWDPPSPIGVCGTPPSDRGWGNNPRDREPSHRVMCTGPPLKWRGVWYPSHTEAFVGPPSHRGCGESSQGPGALTQSDVCDPPSHRRVCRTPPHTERCVGPPSHGGVCTTLPHTEAFMRSFAGSARGCAGGSGRAGALPARGRRFPRSAAMAGAARSGGSAVCRSRDPAVYRSRDPIRNLRLR